MQGMRNPFFQDAHQVLKASSDLAQIQRVVQESQALLAAVRELLPAGLERQVSRVRRSDPARGVRGSELTIVASTTAAATKLRLALADRIPDLQAKGWGIQSIRVLAPRTQSIDNARPTVAPRRPIPAAARQQFAALSESAQSEALKRALLRMGPRGR